MLGLYNHALIPFPGNVHIRKNGVSDWTETDYYLNYSYLLIVNCKPDVAVKSHIGASAAIRGSSVVL